MSTCFSSILGKYDIWSLRRVSVVHVRELWGVCSLVVPRLKIERPVNLS